MRKKQELSDPNSCTNKSHDEEMIFVLTSRDAAAPAAIRAWVDERLRLGKNAPGDPQIVEALECVATMEREGRLWTRPYPLRGGDLMRHENGFPISDEEREWTGPGLTLTEALTMGAVSRGETVTREFPILRSYQERRGAPTGRRSVPWEWVAPFEEQAKNNHSQSLERLAQRGGLGPSELHAIVHGRHWRDQPTEAVAEAWLAIWNGAAPTTSRPTERRPSGPQVECTVCQGLGAIETTGARCLTCGGSGWVSQ